MEGMWRVCGRYKTKGPSLHQRRPFLSICKALQLYFILLFSYPVQHKTHKGEESCRQ